MSKMPSVLDHGPGGDPFRAVRELTDLNRQTPDPEREHRLVHLRHLAAKASGASPRRADWPPDLEDPAPEVVDDIVWITPDRLDLATVGGALRHHGCVAVRGLVDRARAEALAEGVDEVFAAREEVLAGAAPESVADRYREFAPEGAAEGLTKLRAWVRDAGAVWAADAPHLLDEVLAAFDEAHLVDLVEAYLGERPALSVNKSVLRKVTPEAYPSWHQDGAFLGEAVRAVNVWVALTPCGGDRDAPGMEMVPRRLDGLVETGTEGAFLSKEVSPRMVEGMELPVVRPEFDPGDALVFDDTFLHRTFTTPEMDRDRYAVEWWMFAPSGFPPGYVPLAI